MARMQIGLVHVPRAPAVPSQAITWAWADKVALRVRPLGPKSSLITLSRSSKIDGHALISAKQNQRVVDRLPKP